MYDVLDDLRATFAGQYDIERELSGGGMSRLFLATEKGLGRQVVIKVLPPELTSAVGAARFRRETEVTARLQHPNILPILSAGAQGDVLYYVMPFVAGESLRARMTREGALPVADALRLLVEVADALACAHEAGVIHRDIKPENVLLQSGHALLADFGVAAALSGESGGGGGEQKLTRTGAAPGTVGYMAPEQLAGDGDVDARADMYALGVVAYELLAGRRLFEAENAQALLAAHLVDEPERLDEVRFDVPGHVARTIERALAKKREGRWQTAVEFRDALQRSLAAVVSAEGGIEKDPLGRRMKVAVRRLRSSMTTRRMTVPEGVARPRGWRPWAVIGVLMVAVAGGAIWWPTRDTAPSEFVTIAVAPFTLLVPDSELELWREGIVDVMARNLDGAGTIKTVAPTVVLSRAPSNVGQHDAAEFARRVNAQYALVGALTPTAQDSISVRAWIVDAVSDSVVRDTTWRVATVQEGVDRMSIDVIRVLSSRHRIGATHADSSLASTKPAALRAFLRGEQYYRRTAWDSALVAYHQATEVDSTFALPARRVALVREWVFGSVDSVASQYALRAGRFAHKLGPRDSLLTTADSVAAALNAAQRSGLSTSWALARRLFSTLDAAVQRYPNDPEVWYSLGEARFHHGYGSVTGVTERAALEAFDRSIALDSSFAPAYVHSVELALVLDGSDAALRRSRPYLRLNPTDDHAEAIRFVDRLVSARAASRVSTQGLDSIPTEVVRRAWYATVRWRDSAQTGLRLLSVIDRRLRRGTPEYNSEFRRLRSLLALQYSYRGRFAEAYFTMGDFASRLYGEMTRLGGQDAHHADSVMKSWIGDESAGKRAAVTATLAWWAERADSAAIQRVLVDMRRRAAGATGDAQRASHSATLAAEAYLSLARRDTAAALRALALLPDTLCQACYAERLTYARLLAARGELARADTVLRERLWTLVSPIEVLFFLERGRVAAALGRHEDAARELQMVIDAWSSGDPAAQRYVNEARAALRALETVPKRTSDAPGATMANQ